MKTKFKRTIAFLIILAVCAGVCACGKDSTAESEEDILLEAGGYSVYADEARYYAYTRQASYEAYYIAYGQEIDWQSEYEDGVTYEDAVKESVLEDMCRRLAVNSYASEYSVSTDEDDEAEAKQMAVTYFNETSKQLLQAVNISEERLCSVFLSQILYDKVCDMYIRAADMEVSYDDYRQAAISFIQIAGDDTDEQLEAVAKKIVHNIKDGVSTEEAAAEYGYEATSCNIGENDNDGSEFAETALSLASGDSDWVEENGVYYVIYCDSEYDESATDEAYAEAVDDLREQAADAMYSEWKESVEIKINSKLWSEINFNSHIFVGLSNICYTPLNKFFQDGLW